MEQQIQQALAQYVNWVLVLAIGATVEVLKVYLPDNIESRIIPFISMVLGILIAVFLMGLGTSGIPMGVVSGIVASGCYGFIVTMINKIFGGGK